MGNLTPELLQERDKIKAVAETYGLDFYETVFELVDAEELNEIASYGGFPRRYPHWRFGMEYDQLAKSYEYGLSKIYELVINNDPCYAYLMRNNPVVDQKLVMAHVYGHCDFFKNNLWFAHTNRKMIDQMANHGTQVRRFVEAVGQDAVEDFLDIATSLDNLIDVHSVYRKAAPRAKEEHGSASRRESIDVPRLRAKDYMERYINPPEYLERERQRMLAEQSQAKRFPPKPVKDVLAFLIEHAPLEPWEREILSLIREEAYYFAPQGMTKIMNEGWASFWHSRIMTRHALTDAEIIDFADHHSGTVHATPGRINPYKLGIELFRDIETRWNKGRFGREWERCDDAEKRLAWDLELGEGMKKIFEVRKIYNDITFLEEFLTPEFAEEQKLFVYGMNQRTGRVEILDRDPTRVKKELLKALTNFGQPYITVADANYANRGELLLEHRWDGVEIQVQQAQATLRNVQRLWRRPVHLHTFVEGKGRVLSFDGRSDASKETDERVEVEEG